MLNNNIIDFIILSLIGIICGISMGSIGIGSGVIIMPLLILYGINFKTAVAAIMVMQLFPQSILGVFNYYKDINWYISLIILIASFIGIYIGSYIVSNNYISELTIFKILTIILIIISVYFSIKYLL
tara:strand:+ start:695 stop:1075 length:381 start_codon:yes stop_codon:yes gene_type:complete